MTAPNHDSRAPLDRRPMMADDLDLPEFLDLRIPANLAAWKAGRRDWRPTSRASAGPEARKINRDGAGRRLPDSMDAQSWALFRSIERDTAEKAAAEKIERAEVRAIERNARAQVREQARKAKGAA